MKTTIGIGVGIAALISGAALANAMEARSAQDGVNYGSPGLEQVRAMESRSSQQGAEEKGATSGERGGQASVEQAERNAATARQNAEQPGMKQGAENQAAGEHGAQQGKTSEMGASQTGAAERQGATGANEPGKAAGTAEQGRAAQFNQQEQFRGQQQGAQGRAPLAQGQGSSRPQATQQARPGAQTAQPQQLQGQARTQGAAISPDQQARIRDTIRNDNVARIDRPNFQLNVGAVVPRSERLAILPQNIVAIVPQYRGYRFAVVEDEIVIVDPHTYRVAAVIPETGEPGVELGGPLPGPAAEPAAPIGPGGRTCRC